jgi:hypothetical protein
MITAAEVAGVASDTGFRAEIVEKVLRLRGILRRLDRHEITQGTCAHVGRHPLTHQVSA